MHKKVILKLSQCFTEKSLHAQTRIRRYNKINYNQLTTFTCVETSWT